MGVSGWIIDCGLVESEVMQFVVLGQRQQKIRKNQKFVSVKNCFESIGFWTTDVPINLPFSAIMNRKRNQFGVKWVILL